MAIGTDEDLEKVFSDLIAEVIPLIANRAKKLLQQHINTDTYGISKNNMGKPNINKCYSDGKGTPSYEFRDKAWNVIISKEIFSLFYSGDAMSHISSQYPYLHGNIYTGEDRRLELADLLNVSGVDKDNDWGGKKREPFWDNFLEDLNQKIGGWLYTEFNNKGIKIPALKLYKGNFIG